MSAETQNIRKKMTNNRMGHHILFVQQIIIPKASWQLLKPHPTAANSLAFAKICIFEYTIWTSSKDKWWNECVLANEKSLYTFVWATLFVCLCECVGCMCLRRISELNSYQTNISLIFYGTHHFVLLCMERAHSCIDRYRLVLYHTRAILSISFALRMACSFVEKIPFYRREFQPHTICHCIGMNKSVKTLFVFHPVPILYSVSTTQTSIRTHTFARWQRRRHTQTHTAILKLNAIHIFDHNGIICYISLYICMLG